MVPLIMARFMYEWWGFLICSNDVIHNRVGMFSYVLVWDCSFIDCGKDLEKGSLVAHRQTQCGVAKGGLRSELDEADGAATSQGLTGWRFLGRRGIGPAQSKSAVARRRRRRK